MADQLPDNSETNVVISFDPRVMSEEYQNVISHG